MEAALLMLDVLGLGLVLLWAMRGQGGEGLLGWRAQLPPRRKD